MKNIIYKIITLSVLTGLFVTACSDSSSSTKPDMSEISNDTLSSFISEDEQSSSSLVEIQSSSSENVKSEISSSSVANEQESSDSSDKSSSSVLESSDSFEPSSSSEEPLSPSSSSIEPEEPLSDECLALRNASGDFPKVAEILPCVKKSEKIAFILRHAARNKSATNETDGLNDEGRAQSIALGEQLKDTEDIYFMYTKVYRTMETVLKIAEGKGQNFSESKMPFDKKIADDHEQSADLEDSYLIKDQSKYQSCRDKFSWSWSAFSCYAYEESVPTECQETFYDIDDRLAEFVDTYFTYEKMHNITIAISHDKVMVPMVIAASKRQAQLQFHQHENDFNYWLNYLTGIAIIVDSENNVTIIPTTGVDDPYLRVYPEN